MRRPRLKAPAFLPVAYYHCVSRVVNRDFVLGEEEKDKLVEYMRLYERLGGLRVLSYCIMSNHFHILVEVPQRPAEADLPDDAALVAKVRGCLGDKPATVLEWELSHHRGQGNTAAAEALREKWLSRMWDVSAFMKVLKQRFSQWFNGPVKRSVPQKRSLASVPPPSQSPPMRLRRLKAPAFLPVAYYHCVSRVVDRRFALGEEEKDKLVEYMRTYERFGGLRVISYCIMSNHFHILMEVPQRPDAAALPDDAGLVARVRTHLGDKLANDLEWQLELHRKQGNTAAAEELRERWFGRMWDISAYMKVLKQRFTQWFNGRHRRRGTLWEDRFRSVLVEGKGQALRAMAAYIDLNPVRAKICDDPKDYRWCGYAEALAGGKEAREAVAFLASLNPHGGMRPEAAGKLKTTEALRRWRCHLFGIPESEARQMQEAAKGDMAAVYRDRIPREKALEVLARGGKLSQADYLRCKVRYFSDGAVIGGKAFVDEMFAAFRDRFGPKRKDGARPLRGLAGDSKEERLFNFRQLRTGVFG